MIIHSYLIKRLCVGVFVLVIFIIITTRMWGGRDTKTGKTMKYIWGKTLYSRVLPVLLMLLALWYAATPVLDILDAPNVHKAEGIVTTVSPPSRKASDGTYTVMIDGQGYYVPLTLFPYKEVEKGKSYTLWHYKYTHLVHMIFPTPTQ